MDPAERLAAGAGRPLDAIGLGEAMVELWAEEPLGSAPALRRAYGGDVLNSLVMLARLGRRAAFASRVGDDPFGAALRAAWEAEGIDLRACPLVAGVNGVYFIARLPGGEREFSYRRRGSAAAAMDPDDLDEDAIGAARALLLSGITQAISDSARAATLRAARVARERGTFVVYDPNHRPALWLERGGDAAARAAFAELLPHVDLLLPSFPADAALLGSPADPAALADAARAAGVPRVACKEGAAGASWHDADRTLRAPPPEGTRVVDTTGAGDAWNAGLLDALLAGADPAAALVRANRVAAWKIERRGAVPPRDPALPPPL